MDRIKARAASTPVPFGFLHRSGNQDRTNGLTPSARSTFSQRPRDPNCTDSRLLLNQKCIYERQLPGNSYITAHIARLQKGYYDSPIVHGDRVENCRFIAINFVFHPINTTHRFISARISLSLQDKEAVPQGGLPLPPQFDHPNNARPSFSKATTRRKPKFLRHAPHLLYGSLSPETLDWTFNLAGSLGVSQGPANASINPSGGVKSSYKVYKMMKIQGSVRTLNSWHGIEYDVEDGALVWTLEENELQKSGLPREFTFVMLLTKGDASDVIFDIDVEPVVGSWYGTYPKWWIDRIWYRPMHKESIDIDQERGQRFGPSTKTEGFNFASLMGTFDDFVTMPGTVYSRSDNPAAGTMTMNDGRQGGAQAVAPTRQLSASPAPQFPQDLNIRVFLEGSSKQSLFGSNNAADTKSNSSQRQSGLVISRPRTSNRPRPRSEHYPSTTAPLDSPRTAKARPVSAIYEVSSPPLSDAEPGDQRQDNLTSATTDITDDLFLTPLSPGPGLHISRSLRHARSRPDLQDEYENEASSKTPARPPQSRRERNPNYLTEAGDAAEQPRQSGPITTEPTRRPQSQANDQRQGQEQGQSKPDLKVVPRYPRRVGAQPMRRTSNVQQPATTPAGATSTAESGRPNDLSVLKPQNPNAPLSSSLGTLQKRVTPRQARNSAYINPADLDNSRYRFAEDSPTLPPPMQPPSFPPTSYPNFAPTTSAPLNSHPPALTTSTADLPPPAPIAPSAPPPSRPPNDSFHGLGVDTLVQQEVSNYLKSHPELYSPQSSRSNMATTHDPDPAAQPGPDRRRQNRNHSADPADATSKLRAMDVSNAPDLSPLSWHSFPVPDNARPSTAVGSAPNGQQIYNQAFSRPVPNGNRVKSNIGNDDAAAVQASNRPNKHRRSQSMQQTPSHREFNGTHSPLGFDIGHRREQSRSRSRDRSAVDGAANGEFIRVSLGGVGHGGWEYLE